MIRLSVNDTRLEPSFDGYDRDVVVKPWRSQHEVELKQGWNTIELEVIGKAPESRGFVAGIDQLTFTP